MIQNLKLIHVHPSKTNPRKHFDENELTQLAENIKLQGVLQPILVRAFIAPQAGVGQNYEIVAGERRYRAAKLAGKEDIPCIVRELSDVQVLEIQVIENMQRDDLHPLEEAQGYKNLILTKQYDVAKIAGAVSRPHRYVYDRLRLLELIPQAQKLFVEGTIQTGHAVLLSRLTKEQQEQAIDTSEIGTYRTGGLFQAEIVKDLFDPDTDGEEKMPPVKLRSVREFEDYINEHVRMEPSQPDIPELLPETAGILGDAIQEQQKVVLITRLNFVPEEARVGDKIAFPRSWRRADGVNDSNDPHSYEWKGYKPATCEHSVMGFVAVGPGRGEAFPVCTAKKKCKTHWADAMKAAKENAKARESAPAPAAASPKKAKDDAAKHKRAREIDELAGKMLDEIIVARAREAKPRAIVELVVADMANNYGASEPLKRYGVGSFSYNNPKILDALEKLTDADLQAVAVELMMVDAGPSSYVCHAFGIDLKGATRKLTDDARKIIDGRAHAPVEKPKAEKKPTPAKKKPKKAKRT